MTPAEKRERAERLVREAEDLPSPGPVAARDVVLTILTGRRPDLLQTLLRSLERAAPRLLLRSEVIVLHNGGDGATTAAIQPWRALVDDLLVSSNLLTIGHATSILAEAAFRSGKPFWLHLEDDWQALPTHPEWLEIARDQLMVADDMVEVRLRHVGEPMKGKHRVTGEEIEWQREDGVVFSPSCHLNFTPALRRTGVARRVFPADDEQHAQLRAHQAGFTAVAQLDPGLFVHTGYERSLRATVGAP